MSLFDMIKYPISDRHTRKELSALPFQVRVKYIRRCIDLMDENKDFNRTEVLKKVLLEHNNDDI